MRPSNKNGHPVPIMVFLNKKSLPNSSFGQPHKNLKNYYTGANLNISGSVAGLLDMLLTKGQVWEC
jgi:hypothetical protein